MQLMLLEIAGIAVLFQFGNQRLGLALRLFEHLPRLVLCLAQLAFALRGDFLLQLFGLVAQPLRFQMRLLRERALLFGDLAMVFGVCNDVFKPHLIAREPLVRILNQRLRKAQLAGHFKCVRFARHADRQPIGRPQRFNVEFHRRVFHALRAERIGLQLAVMRGREGVDPALQERIENRHRQRRALSRVGARAELVEQHQRARRDLIQNAHDVRHVRGEGRKRLLDRLLVADVGKYLVKNRKFRAVGRGNLHARLRHQRQKTDGLERYGLAAGVRAGDHQRGEVLAHPDRGGHHLFRIDQRVARLNQVDFAAFIQLRRNGAHAAAERRARKNLTEGTGKPDGQEDR